MEAHSYICEKATSLPLPYKCLLEPVRLVHYPTAPSGALPDLVSTVPRGTSLHPKNDAHNHDYSNNNHYHYLLGAHCVPGYLLLTRT